MSSGNKILTHSSIYLIGNVLQRSVSFIMLPIYTRFLTPSDYGTIELLSMAIDFVSLIFGLRISDSIFRYYSKYVGDEKKEVISTSLYLVIFFSLVGMAIVCLFSRQISVFTFGDTSQTRNLLLFSVTLLGQGVSNVPMTAIRAEQRPVLFVVISTARLLLRLSLNIYFVVYLNMKVEGVIYSSVIATLIVTTILSFYVFKNFGFSYSRIKSRELVMFSIPLLLSDMFAFYLTFGDRYFIRAFHGTAEVGIYSLGYKFAALLPFIITRPFSDIWSSERYEIAKNEKLNSKFSSVFLFFNIALVSFCLFLSLFSKEIIDIMASEDFIQAYLVVPVLLAAYVVQSWTGYVNLGIFIKGKTFEIFYATLLAVAIISVGYFLLIPHFGGLGAAFATLFAFIARFMWIYYRSNKLFCMNIKWIRILFIYFICVIIVFIGSFSPDYLLFSLLLKMSYFIAFYFILFLFPLLTTEDRGLVYKKVNYFYLKMKGR